MRGGPNAKCVQTLLELQRSVDLATISNEMNNRIMSRAVLRLYLAITRQNSAKATTATAAAATTGTGTGAAAAAATGAGAGVGRNQPTAVKVSQPPQSVFESIPPTPKPTSASRKSDKDLLNEMLFGSSISISVASAEGLAHTPYFVPTVDKVLRALTDTFSGFISDLSPFPPTLLSVIEQVDGSRASSSGATAQMNKYAAYQVIGAWDTSISNTALSFSENGRGAQRPGSVSSYPAALCKTPSDQCSFSVVLAEGKISSNWLTIGVCLNSFPNSSSDGFGKQNNSWCGSHYLLIYFCCF